MSGRGSGAEGPPSVSSARTRSWGQWEPGGAGGAEGQRSDPRLLNGSRDFYPDTSPRCSVSPEVSLQTCDVGTQNCSLRRLGPMFGRSERGARVRFPGRQLGHLPNMPVGPPMMHFYQEPFPKCICFIHTKSYLLRQATSFPSPLTCRSPGGPLAALSRPLSSTCTWSCAHPKKHHAPHG